jgi:glycosyltransferase involved in cell wall biosynthesis
MANNLASKGWDVTAIAPQEDYFARYQGSEDRNLISWVSPSVKVKRLSLTNPFLETDLRRLTLGRAVNPERYAVKVRNLQREVSPLDHYPFWYRPVVRAGLRASALRRFHVILATGNPFSSFVAARTLCELTKRPYVLDYRDAWTLDQFNGSVKPGATDAALALEYKLLSGAAGVISVNSEILSWLETTHVFPSSVERLVVPNGYDPEFVVENTDTSARSPDVFRLLHIGTLVPEKMDWARMLGQFSRTAHFHKDVFYLDLYGHLGFSGRQAVELRRLFESDDYVNYRGPVQRDQVANLYAQADILYLPLYDSPYVTSGKVYEMMATGKPILAWGAESAGALRPLQGYPNLVRADTARPSSWMEAMATAARMAREPSGALARSSREFAAKYERARQLEPLDGFLRRIARHR